MLYHVPDRKKALSEINRVLKRDGTFHAAANGARHIAELRDMVKKFDELITYDYFLCDSKTNEVIGMFIPLDY
jgi:ubiquinone/menaquinone biosynthesis C-methylase UbiE